MAEWKSETLTQVPVEHVDATPDADYPLRILRAHRQRCDCRWVMSGLDDATTQVYEQMNKDQEERAAILDDAIECLEQRE